MSTEIEAEPALRILKVDCAVEVGETRDIAGRAVEVIVTIGLKVASEVRVLIAIDANDAVAVAAVVAILAVIESGAGEAGADLCY